jgi:hypothetical protein
METRVKRGIYKFLKPVRVDSHLSCQAKMEMHCHAFAVLDVNPVYCTGYMLTHAPTKKFPEHKQMKPEHFVVEPGLFQYDNELGTYYLTVPLVKFNSMSTRQVGTLTEAGEQFILKYARQGPRTWEEYLLEYCIDK